MSPQHQTFAFPSFLYGKFADVKKETSKVVTKLKKGVRIPEIVKNYEMITPSINHGKIILNGPSPNNGFDDFFHVFTLPRLLFIGKVAYDPKYREVMQQFFDDMMEHPWSHLVMSTGQNVYTWYNNEPNRVTHLKKLLVFREQYERLTPFVEGLPYQAWNLDGSVRFYITDIFNLGGFSGKFIVGNLDHTKKNFSDDEINKILVENDFFRCIELFGIEDYLKTYSD